MKVRIGHYLIPIARRGWLRSTFYLCETLVIGMSVRRVPFASMSIESGGYTYRQFMEQWGLAFFFGLTALWVISDRIKPFLPIHSFIGRLTVVLSFVNFPGTITIP